MFSIEEKRIISEVSKQYKLPVAFIKILINKKVISIPPAYPDKIILSAVKKIFTNEQVLGLALKRLSKKRRQALIDNPGMSKIDKYIYNRLCNSRENGIIVKTAQILSEIVSFYGVDTNNKRSLCFFKKRITSLRNKCRRTKRGIASQQIANI